MWDHVEDKWISATLLSQLRVNIHWSLKLWGVIYWFPSLGCLGWFYSLRISEKKNIFLSFFFFLKERSIFIQIKVYTKMSKVSSHIAKTEAGHFRWPGRQPLYWLGSESFLVRGKIRRCSDTWTLWAYLPAFRCHVQLKVWRTPGSTLAFVVGALLIPFYICLKKQLKQ